MVFRWFELYVDLSILIRLPKSSQFTTKKKYETSTDASTDASTDVSTDAYSLETFRLMTNRNDQIGHKVTTNRLKVTNRPKMTTNRKWTKIPPPNIFGCYNIQRIETANKKLVSWITGH